MDHKHGTLLDDVGISNNQAHATILETHNHIRLKLFGDSTSNLDLVVLGSNNSVSEDWYKCGDIVKSDSHCNISGGNALGVTLHYRLH